MTLHSGSPVFWEDKNDGNRAYLAAITSATIYGYDNDEEPDCGPEVAYTAQYTKIFYLRRWFKEGSIYFDECYP